MYANLSCPNIKKDWMAAQNHAAPFNGLLVSSLGVLNSQELVLPG